MYINKISGVNLGFKGYHHIINDVGETILKFNYPYDYENETCEIQIFRVIPAEKYNYKVLNDKPIYEKKLKPEGLEVNLGREANLGKDEPFAYKIIKKDKNGNIIWQGADSGIKIRLNNNNETEYRDHIDEYWEETTFNPVDKDSKPIPISGNQNSTFWYKKDSEFKGYPIKEYQYTLVKRNGTVPLVQGPGYIAMPDTFMPGMRYKSFDEDGTGELVYDEELQKKMEGVVVTSSNMLGGGIAGLEAYVPTLRENGFKILSPTPIANGDNRFSHGYCNKNNMQTADNMGTSENYNSLMKTEFKNGIGHVFDITLTSEGLEGIHARYAMRWGAQAQTSRWFRMSGLNDSGIVFGFIPQNDKNLRHRVINHTKVHSTDKDGSIKSKTNDSYNSHSETYIQLYDATQVTEEQLKQLDKPIDMYRELKAGKNLEINDFNDTVPCYIFEINPDEYEKNIQKINRLIKNDKRKIELNSPEGTLLATTFSNFSLAKDSEGYEMWEANPDLIKMFYSLSASDDKELQAIADPAERQHEYELRLRATKETQDLAIQVGKYWADRTKTVHTIYTAQNVGTLNTAEKINDLITKGILPEEVRSSQSELNNIINGNYNLSPKGKLKKDDVTVKSMMKLPLDSLEFGENTVGVLSTSYFSNRATTDETIGISRFDLMKQNNNHLVQPYTNVYKKVNSLFTNELNQFAQSVIKEVNKTSAEPLIDSNGEYTEYGEYVIELLGQRIAKYALLKSLAGENLKYKILPDGDLTYNYQTIKKVTSLKALGINASNPTEEAEILQRKIQKGLLKLNENDINAVANAISQTIKGTNVNSFRIAEALVEKSGLGLNFRLDAVKNIMNINDVLNRDSDFDDTWKKLINFWAKFVKGVKEVNPHSNIIAEMTDVADVMRETNGGPEAEPFNGRLNVLNAIFKSEPDAMTKFFMETGITTEAAYSYFFTELLTVFSKNLETGADDEINANNDSVKHKYDLLLNTRSADYMRNLYSFVGNHDKTRIIHGLAVDIGLFHSTLIYYGADFNKNHNERLDVIRVLSGAHNMDEVPLELRLNVDNLDYFRTVSPRAVAQTKLLMDSAAEDLKGIASNDDIELIRSALVDLANGNYLNSKITEKMTKINIPELSSLENAVKKVAEFARNHGIYLSDSEIDTITANAKSLNTEDYLVRGDCNWTEPEYVGNTNKSYLREILGSDSNCNQYSMYTVQIARMIKKAAENTAQAGNLNSALADFVREYNLDKINQNMDSFKMFEDNKIAKRKNSYAYMDFRIALEEALNQAEFKSGKTISNKDEIIATIYKSITEPALYKHAMILSFLSAMCGISSIYAGDEFVDTGFEFKSRNMTLKNRMAVRFYELAQKTLMGKYINNTRDITYSALKNKVNVKPLQNGIPYSMDVMVDNKNRDEIHKRIAEINKILKEAAITPDIEKDLLAEQAKLRLACAKYAFMMQSSDGDMAISVFNATDIDHNNRVNYYEKFGLKTQQEKEDFLKENNIESINPDNPYIPMQRKSEMDAILLGAGVSIPIGTQFINANGIDKAMYVVSKINGKIGIVRKEGDKICKIIFDGITSKYGTMVLRLAKNVAFKGSQKFYNKQYNIAPKSYFKNNENTDGKVLSIIVQ